MRDAFADVLFEIGQADPRLCALVADISPAGSMVKFREQFPERFINTGVAEQAMIGIAAGLALRGMRPFCYTIATFSLFREKRNSRSPEVAGRLAITALRRARRRSAPRESRARRAGPRSTRRCPAGAAAGP